MATDFFLKLDGIKGESTDDKHKDEIDIMSWSWGASQQGTFSGRGGGGAGKADLQDITFTMLMNTASPKLMELCATGEHIKKAQLVCRKAGGKQQEYLKVDFTELLVSSYQTGASSGGDAIPIETFSLNFSKIEFDYKPQKEDGTLGGSVKAGYDQKANKKT